MFSKPALTPTAATIKALPGTDLYSAISDRDTVEGDCGALVITETGRGPVISGLHIAQDLDVYGMVYMMTLTKSKLETILQRFDSQIIQPGKPNLNCATVQNTLSPQLS